MIKYTMSIEDPRLMWFNILTGFFNSTSLRNAKCKLYFNILISVITRCLSKMRMERIVYQT